MEIIAILLLIAGILLGYVKLIDMAQENQATGCTFILTLIPIVIIVIVLFNATSCFVDMGRDRTHISYNPQTGEPYNIKHNHQRTS